MVNEKTLKKSGCLYMNSLGWSLTGQVKVRKEDQSNGKQNKMQK